MIARVVVIAAGALALLSCANGVGERCADNAPCPPSLRCSKVSADAESGVCDYPPRTFGEACSRADECEETLTCSSHFTPGERYGTCVHLRADGQPCYVNRDCQSGVCEGATPEAVTGTCTPG